MLITQTPLRISFAGGGTDLAAYYTRTPGAVLSSAIDKYIYVIVHRRFDDRIVIGYMKKEVVDAVDEIQHELVRESLRMAGIERGIEITIMADIPSEGSGLGSSSSLTVGLLNAFHTYQGVQPTPEQLAEEACEIEIGRCGKPIGKQDQYIAAFGGMQFFEFLPDGRVRATRCEPPGGRRELDSRLHLYYTNVVRKSESVLTEQKARTEQGNPNLDGIRDLAYAARDEIRAGRVAAIGELLRKNWELKRGLASGVSNGALDGMVQRAMDAGAAGCKICGAGGGGFLLVYCEKENQPRLREAMKAYREMPFFLDRYGSKVIFNVEGYEWK